MNPSPDLLLTAVKMLLALGATIGVLLLAFKFTRGMIGERSGRAGQGMVKVLSSTYIGVKKSISLVEVPGAVLVLGISGEGISLLSTIDDPETLNAIRHPAHGDSAGRITPFARMNVKRYVRHMFTPLQGRGSAGKDG